MVSETAASFQGLALTRGKTFEMDVAPMLSMVGNEKQIRQLVSILLDNAMKYSDEHGRIRLSLRRQGRSIRLEVENTADGISKESARQHVRALLPRRPIPQFRYKGLWHRAFDCESGR